MCMPKLKNGSPNQIDCIKWLNEISLKTLSDAECGVGDLEIFSVYPRLSEVFFPVFPVCLNAQNIKQV